MNFGKIEYLFAKFRNIFWVILRRIIGYSKFTRKSYNGKKIESYDFTNREILKALLNEKTPFLASRFGDTELRTVIYTIEICIGLRKKYPRSICEKMRMNAGFFPATQENMFLFGKLMIESCKEVDIFGVWYNLLEDFVIDKFNPRSKLVVLESLEPYRNKNPWSAALKGKKVLVIHPFAETINNQYQRREKIFDNKNVLPDFELITLKAVQSNANSKVNYEDWFIALEDMYQKAKNIDFDIAIVGCGSYGMPLSAKLKQLNKKVIHLAGATQLLFGIRGARWDERPEMKHLFNDNWVRPAESETPELASKVEGGCYW